jgi:hypothetical protein
LNIAKNCLPNPARSFCSFRALMTTGVSSLRDQLVSSRVHMATDYCSCSPSAGPENWIVYKAWWGNKPSMTKGDLSGIAGVNSFNTVHPVRIFKTTIYCKKDMEVKFSQASCLSCFATFRENYSSVDCQKFKPREKSMSDGRNSREPFASMVVLGVLPVLCQRIQPLHLWKWRTSAWPTWRSPNRAATIA